MADDWFRAGAGQDAGAWAVNETVPLNRLSEFSRISEVPVCPETIDSHEGETLMLKSGCITCSSILKECDSDLSGVWPVTTTLYSPAEVLEGTIMLIVVVADWLYFIDNVEDAILAVTLVSEEADKFTVPLNL